MPTNQKTENISEQNSEFINTIDIQLLEERIYSLNSDNKFYGYQKTKNWLYYAKVNSFKLDIAYKDPDDLIKALNTIKHMINTYKKAWYEWKLYVKNWMLSWADSVWEKLDIYVDNRLLFPDTTFLTNESIKKCFRIKNKSDYNKIVNFLNQILWLEEKK